MAALLSRVRLSHNTVSNCFNHAFITEKEEVMGVLLGDIVTTNGERVAHIWDSFAMARSIQQCDRVEISPDSLIAAAEEAERLTQETGQTTRVIGWYHSHPHITPFPSAVDLNSQKVYQQMESCWVGLIFSVFNQDSNHHCDCSMHCFQTGPGDTHIQIPHEICAQHHLGISVGQTVPERQDRLLGMLASEYDNAVDNVRVQTAGHVEAIEAAEGLSRAQLFMLSRLAVEPCEHNLESFSIPQLETLLHVMQNSAAR